MLQTRCHEARKLVERSGAAYQHLANAGDALIHLTLNLIRFAEILLTAIAWVAVYVGGAVGVAVALVVGGVKLMRRRRRP
ncbi:hypothetical protein CLG96_18160 [Sphingomonas oleivorans]|uniref:Uncharacterized protein n=1 Tax=Sphingomonas oleivorans TaxID=1735121 RepID=A0A2T5FTR2_9SPHN|nr:hypothetical protein CLG96_18160 [Sphingomonas oleivorans]